MMPALFDISNKSNKSKQKKRKLFAFLVITLRRSQNSNFFNKNKLANTFFRAYLEILQVLIAYYMH